MSLIPTAGNAKALHLVSAAAYSSWLKNTTPFLRSWLVNSGFSGKSGDFALLPSVAGELDAVLLIGEPDNMYALARLPFALPAGDYVLAQQFESAQQQALVLGWCLGCDRYTRYRKSSVEPARLVVKEPWRDSVLAVAEAVCSARAMVNTPAQDLGPEQLGDYVRAMAVEFGATYREIVGEALLQENFPAIHAVGRASHRLPRLLELNWGAEDAPRLALVGKGVCFDTGGLDIKAADGMALMKKDMGGAAVAIQLARLVMHARLNVRLQLLVPAVENAIGPESYRPGDVIRTRAGLSVEIGNTDAEGRVILCDALSYAAESKPSLIIDFATLTGAARIALGPDLPATFSHHDEVVNALIQAGTQVNDPLWRMPLWAPYQRLIDSSIADMNNAGASRMAGAVTAALYLERFVPKSQPWVHIDTYCWNDSEQPGRPKGGACQALRAGFAYLSARYAT